MRQTLLICLLAALGGNLPRLRAQVSESAPVAEDTGSRVKPMATPWEAYLLNPKAPGHFDTAVDFIHRYAPVFRSEPCWQDLGHAGSPAKSLLPAALNTPGLRSGLDAYQLLLRPPMETVYNARNPYTRFHYTQGNMGLIGLQALHTQNITPGWNTTIDYHSLQSQGIYEHSAHKQRNIQTASNYRSANGRFVSRITGTWNRFQRNEHWGLRDSARLFAEQPSIFLPRNTAAKSAYTHTNHQIHNSWALADSGVWSGLLVVNRLRFTRERFEYEDKNTPDTFYPAPKYYEMQGCADSFYLREAAAETGLMYSGGALKSQNLKPWSGDVFFGTSSIRAGAYRAVPGKYHNSWLRTSLGYGAADGRKNALRAEAVRYLSGYNAGDFLLSLSGRLAKAQRYVGFRYTNQRSTAAFTERFYFSKHFSWNQNLSTVNTSEWQWVAGISAPNTDLEVNYRNGTVRGYVYMDHSFSPRQFTGALNYGDLALKSRSEWRHLFLMNDLHFTGSSESAVMPLPRFSGRHSLGYKGLWFNKVLRVRAGADLWWYSRFYGYGYHPATGRFYVQQQIQTGNYPLLDLFVNGEVKNLQFFVKMEHLNQGWFPTETPYWSAAAYAFEPRRFRLGLRWGFFN